MAELGAGESVETHSGLGCLDSKITMNLRRNAHHKFAAKLFDRNRFGHRFVVCMQIGNNFTDKFAYSLIAPCFRRKGVRLGGVSEYSGDARGLQEGR